MEHRTDQTAIKGSPELALLVFAILAVFAYLLMLGHRDGLASGTTSQE